MRRTNGRAPGSTEEANCSLPMSEARKERLILCSDKATVSRDRSSARRSGVQDNVCATESSWMPRKDNCCVGPSVFSVLTTRPKSEKICCADCMVVSIAARVKAMKRKSSR